MGIIKAAAFAALALSATAANAAPFVNGSFEAGPNPGSFTTVGGGSTAITGWTVGGHSIDYIGSYWTAQDGGRSIDLAGNGNGSIAQTFDTIIGAIYNVSYWVSRNPDGALNPRTGFIDVGGAQTQFTYGGAGSHANMQWEKNTYAFTATGSSTTLTFAADPSTSQGYYGAALDNVSVAAVPEPATWGLMMLGFAGVGFAMRRRKEEGGARIRFA